MRRIVLSFSLIAALALLVTLSAVPASAAALSAHRATRANAPARGSCYWSPGAGNCWGQDPHTNPDDNPECDTISHSQGGDVWYTTVYYATDNANNCQSNWGIAWANPSSQYVQMVWLETNDNKYKESTLYYCTVVAVVSVNGPCQGLSVRATIPPGFHSWHTDMFYAPDIQVRLCEIWSPNTGNLNGRTSHCSNWH